MLFWGPWATTWQRWQQEGMPSDRADHRRAFGPDEPPFVIPVNCGPCPARGITVLEEDEEKVLFLDGWGIRRVNFKTHESMSRFIEFPVKDWKDWQAYKEQWLDPDHPDRLAGPWLETAGEMQKKGAPLQLGYFPDVGLFGGVRWLLGDEECLMAFCTAPDLIHDMMDHLTTLYLHVFSQVVAKIQVDVIHIWEDMCGRQGPLIGPAQWEEFMGPHYRRITAFAKEHDIPVVSVDTDGNPELIAACMINAGVNLLFPMEVAAGCDVAHWRRQYPSLALLGGIDKRSLAEGPEAIDAEMTRIRPALEAGRYIPELDHCIPDDVSWDNYTYYVERLKELVGKA